MTRSIKCFFFQWQVKMIRKGMAAKLMVSGFHWQTIIPGMISRFKILPVLNPLVSKNWDLKKHGFTQATLQALYNLSQ